MNDFFGKCAFWRCEKEIGTFPRWQLNDDPSCCWPNPIPIEAHRSDISPVFTKTYHITADVCYYYIKTIFSLPCYSVRRRSSFLYWPDGVSAHFPFLLFSLLFLLIIVSSARLWRKGKTIGSCFFCCVFSPVIFTQFHLLLSKRFADRRGLRCLIASKKTWKICCPFHRKVCGCRVKIRLLSLICSKLTEEKQNE